MFRPTAALAAAGLLAAGSLFWAGQIPSGWPMLAGLAIFGGVGFWEALAWGRAPRRRCEVPRAIGAWTGLLCPRLADAEHWQVADVLGQPMTELDKRLHRQFSDYWILDHLSP